MSKRWILGLCTLTFAWAGAARAQDLVVQLPTFSFFSVNTTVSAPDSGGATLGSMGRVSRGYNLFAPPSILPNRAHGGDLNFGKTTVHAQIHDLHAQDELAEWGLGKKRSRRVADALDGRLRKSLESSAARPSGSLAQARRARQAALAAIQDEAAENIAQGRASETAGRFSLARMYYKRAATQATGELREEAAALLKALPRPASSTTLAKSKEKRPPRE